MGCGDEFELPDETTNNNSVEEQDEPKGFNASNFEGQQAGKWWVEGDNATGILGEDDTTFIIANANGILYDGEEVASRFIAQEGEGRKSDRLILKGSVQVTSERDGVVLTADKVTYNEVTQLIEAEGNVMVTSSTFESGPYDKLVTTPSLDRFGTPDHFKDETP